jgi:hypothetical protein
MLNIYNPPPTEDQLESMLTVFVSLVSKSKHNIIRSWVTDYDLYVEVKDKPQVVPFAPGILKGGLKAWSEFYENEINQTWVIRLSRTNLNLL